MKIRSLKVGIPTMLLLLFSMCLTIFSILSLSSAYSDYKLSAKLFNRTTSYYDACNMAYETIHDAKENNIGEKNFTFTISESEILEVSIDDNYEIILWRVSNISEDDYNEHLNVIP